MDVDLASIGLAATPQSPRVISSGGARRQVAAPSRAEMALEGLSAGNESARPVNLLQTKARRFH